MVSTSGLYGAVIALVSGLYSLWAALAGEGMGLATWVMVLLGVVVIVHGVVLLVGFADRIGYSGPLMVVWAVLMLLNQAWFAAMRDSMMAGGMGSRMGGTATGPMGVDAGMVALAVLMLASGAIMTTRKEGM